MKNKDYRHGTYKVGKHSLEINDDTPVADIKKFLESIKSYKNIVARIKQGVSREAIKMREELSPKQEAERKKRLAARKKAK